MPLIYWTGRRYSATGSATGASGGRGLAGVLQDRAAIITGGSQGIGKAIARAFLAEGCGCLLVARTHSALEATAQELSSIGPSVIAFAAGVGAPHEGEGPGPRP